MASPQPYDHVRVGEGGPIPAGIYRVVGTGAEIAHLRVGDSDGCRVTTGEVVQVNRARVEQLTSPKIPTEGPRSGM